MSADRSSTRQPSHRLIMIVGDSPDDVQAIQIGNAAPSENGRGYDLSLEVTFSVVALPIAPAVLF